jgi:hypothetical protein
MEKLMKPSEYAKEIGISRQAVYAKIKRGILTSKNVEGKLYIIVDNNVTQKAVKKPDTKVETNTATKVTKTQEAPVNRGVKDYKALLSAKDETIGVLKGTVKDLKKSNKQISTTLRGEIDLLKEAFYEMRTLYSHQLEHKKASETIDVMSSHDVDTQESEWMSIKKFFKRYDIENEDDQEIIVQKMRKSLKLGDTRFKNKKGKLKLQTNKNYEDILSQYANIKNFFKRV